MRYAQAEAAPHADASRCLDQNTERMAKKKLDSAEGIKNWFRERISQVA